MPLYRNEDTGVKIMFCGGGTAGHVYPALAMAQIAKGIYRDAEFVFIGRRGGEENAAITKAGYEVEEITVEGLSRSFSIKSLKAIIKAIAATREAGKLIAKHKPDIVIGTGGYVCWPVLKAALSRKIPTAIHESNAYPGLVTRLLASRCDAVMLGFGEAEEYLGRKSNVYVIGNPVRSDFGKISRKYARRRLGIPEKSFLCVSFGGSLGAAKMNDAIIDAIPEITKRHPGYVHVHATGRRYFDSVKEGAMRITSSSASRIVAYLDNVPLWFAAADLAITRAGAITIAELEAAALPSILIPSPNVSDNHQTKNALAKEAEGGAVLLAEQNLSKEHLIESICTLIDTPERLWAMRSALHKKEDRRIELLFSKVLKELLAE